MHVAPLPAGCKTQKELEREEELERKKELKGKKELKKQLNWRGSCR